MGISGAKLPPVDETGLPRTARHSFQRFDVEVTQFDTPLPDFVLRVVWIDGYGFGSLNIWSVRRSEPECGGRAPR